MGTLYVEQRAFLEGIVRRTGVASRDVEDVVHDAFLQIAGAIGRLDPQGGSLRGWLATIARRTARDHLALRRTAEEPSGFDVEDEPSLTDDATPEATILEAERRAYVRHLVGQADEVLARVIFQEQTWAQIAKDLRVPLSTVQARVRRAHAVLEAQLRRRWAADRHRRVKSGGLGDA